MKKSRIFVVIMLITFIITTSVSGVGASNAKYEVYDVKAQKVIKSGISKFSDAEKLMMQSGKHAVVKSSDSESPEQIVASHPKEAYAVSSSYKYENGIKKEDTLKIYASSSLSSQKTLIPTGYKMFYYGTVEENGKLVAHVNIQGAEGYVDLKYIDLVPMSYINQKPIDLRFYKNNRQAVGSFVIPHDYYWVDIDSKTGNREIKFRYHYLSNSNSYTYGIAPDWMPVGTRMYSPDGVVFYHDPQLSSPVSGGKQFYAYYQWLPFRSSSKLTASQMNMILKGLPVDGPTGRQKSIYLNQEHIFENYSKKYGANTLLLFAQAGLESAYGRSNFAYNRYNIFGWNAIDSHPENASEYDNIEHAIKDFLTQGMVQYFNLETPGLKGDARNFGLSYGNKGSGISVKYASDPFYGIKVAGIAYAIDKSLGYQDYNLHGLIKLNDNTSVNVRNSAELGNNVLYTTLPNRVNQIMTYKGTVGEFYKTNPHMAVIDGKAVQSYSKSHPEINTDKDFAYVHQSTAKVLEQFGPVASEPEKPVEPEKPTKPNPGVTVSKDKKTMYVTTPLNLRDTWSTSGKVILTIPKGTKLTVQLTNNGWAKTTYNGHTGYVSADYLSTNSGGNSSNSDKPYKLGDVNNSGDIDVVDLAKVQGHLLGIEKLTGKAFVAADVNKNKEIDVVDLSKIQSHLLGIELIKE